MQCGTAVSQMTFQQVTLPLPLQYQSLYRAQVFTHQQLFYECPVQNAHVLEVGRRKVSDGTFGIQRTEVLHVVDNQRDGDGPEERRREL